MAARPPRKKRIKKVKDNPVSVAQAISKGFIEMHGVVEECLPAASFRIRIDGGQVILAHLSGKMRMNRIRLLPGDEVKIEMTPYDLTKGRIVYRY
ncbi:MAG: translation initiation factor [Candidatus Parcubacteria bacterium]|jgi:translation initiation factor IF-1